ncbi:hypothetical protein JYT59_00930 [Sphingobacteriaceae bacterium AH-315-L07]|nr:hypothetical protein [Sphingobacteriaceae bacterium AH-315-L07]
MVASLLKEIKKVRSNGTIVLKHEHFSTQGSDNLLNFLIPQKLTIKWGNLYLNGFKCTDKYSEHLGSLFNQFINELDYNLINIQDNITRMNYLNRTLTRILNGKSAIQNLEQLMLSKKVSVDTIKKVNDRHVLYGQITSICKTVKGENRTKLKAFYHSINQTFDLLSEYIEQSIIIEEGKYLADISDTDACCIGNVKPSHFGYAFSEFFEKNHLLPPKSWKKLALVLLRVIKFKNPPTIDSFTKAINPNSVNLSASTTQKFTIPPVDDLK